MRDIIRQFLLYSASERRAVIVLCVLIVLVCIAPSAYRCYEASPKAIATDSSTIRAIALFKTEYGNDSIDAENPTVANSSSLFSFDPNTIGITEWLKLGLTEKQAAVIEKYKGKGGKFRKPEDLRKIYVLSDEMKEKLLPYIVIAKEKDNDFKTIVEKPLILDINSADSGDFEELRGIGPARAARIVKYREQLGGYISIDQVAEVYNLPDSVYQEIKPHLILKEVNIKKLNLNEADYETLKKHPYIKGKIAGALIKWRGYNGRFESLDQLKEIKPMNELQLERLKPYISIE